MNGNVGIGTTSPNDMLDIVGNAQVSGFLKVGNPVTPAGVNINNVVFYHIAFSNLAYWNLVQMWCQTVTPEWWAGSASGYQEFNNDGARSLHCLNSPFIWLPHYVDKTKLKVKIKHECTLENGFDGMYLDWDDDNDGTFDKISNWSSGTAYTAGINGCTTGCIDAESTAWDATIVLETATSGYLTPNPTSVPCWSRFRLCGMEDGNTNTGNYRVHEFWLYGDGVTMGTSGFEPGGIYAEGHIFAQSNSQIGDVAEFFPVEGNPTMGDLISMDTNGGGLCHITSKALDNHVIGVYSTAPSVLVNDPKQGIPVGLTGRVPINTTDENGEILSGDFLTSSSTKGKAMKATKPCFVIGRAMGKDQNGKIICLLGSGWYNPTPVSESVSSGNYEIFKNTSKIKVFDICIKSASRVFVSMRANPETSFWISEINDGFFEISFDKALLKDVPFDYLVNNFVSQNTSTINISPKNNKTVVNEKEKNSIAQNNNLSSESAWVILGNTGNIDKSRFAEYGNMKPPSSPPDPNKCWTWDPINGFVEQKIETVNNQELNQPVKDSKEMREEKNNIQQLNSKDTEEKQGDKNLVK